MTTGQVLNLLLHKFRVNSNPLFSVWVSQNIFSIKMICVFVSIKVENKSDEFVLYMVHESGGESWLSLWLSHEKVYAFIFCAWCHLFSHAATLKRKPDWGMTNTHWWLVCFTDPVRKSPRSSSLRPTSGRKSHTMWVWASCHHSLRSLGLFAICDCFFFFFFSIDSQQYNGPLLAFKQVQEKNILFRTDVTIEMVNPVFSLHWEIDLKLDCCWETSLEKLHSLDCLK